MANLNPNNKDTVLKISREFDAPRNLVFAAFSEAKHLAAWWGPVGYSLTVVSLDFRSGGLFHYKMESEERVMWARFVYGKIQKPSLIEFTLSFSDEQAGITRAPFFDSWPLEIFNRLSFTEKEGRTTIVSESYPLNATEQEVKTFIKERASFDGGLNATFDQLVLLLSRI